MTTFEKQINLSQQIERDIQAKVKAIAKWHKGCGEKVIKVKESEYQFRLSNTLELQPLNLYAVSIDGLFDEDYNKYPFDTLSIDELVGLVEYINQL